MKTGWLVAALTASLGIACNNNNDVNGAGAPTAPAPPATTTTPASSFSFLNGTWAGQWIDTRFNVQGTLEATFAVNGNTVTATGTIGLQSLGRGNETGTSYRPRLT